MTWAFKQDVRPMSAKFVFVILANYASGDGYCYASQQRIADDVSQGVRTVRRHLAALEESGWIVRERRMSKRGGRAPDGFYLVGFSDELPANVATSQPAKLATNPPASLAGNSGGVTGHFRQGYRPHSTSPLKEVEPTIEPTIAESSPIPRNGHHKKPLNERWETMAAYHGYRPTPDTPDHGRWNKAEGIWRKIGATTDDMDSAYRLYRKRYPMAAFTVLAVAGRAEELLRSKPPPASDDDLRLLSESWDD